MPTPREIVFTQLRATESNNSARSIAPLVTHPEKRHVLVPPSVEPFGQYQVSAIICRSKVMLSLCYPVESDGSLELHLLEQSIRPDTAIVSVMWGPIMRRASCFQSRRSLPFAAARHTLFHTDGRPNAGKIKSTSGAGVWISFHSPPTSCTPRKASDFCT